MTAPGDVHLSFRRLSKSALKCGEWSDPVALLVVGTSLGPAAIIAAPAVREVDLGFLRPSLVDIHVKGFHRHFSHSSGHTDNLWTERI